MIRLGIAALVVSLAVGYIAVLKREITQVRVDARVSFIERMNTVARLDTTIHLADQYRRLAEQVEIERDSLAVALDERPVLETTIEIKTVEVDTVATVTRVQDTIFVEYVDSAISISAQVVATPPFRNSLHYILAPIHLTVSGRCGSPDLLGHRTATISVATEYRVDVNHAQLDPELCNPIIQISRSRVSTWDIAGPISGFALGLFTWWKWGS